MIFNMNGGGIGTDISDTTATADDVLSPKEFYLADGTKATGLIPTRGNEDLTVFKQTVRVPSGYYPELATKAVDTMTLPTAVTTTNPGVTNKATIGRSDMNQYLEIPEGYNTNVAQYTISGVPNMTLPTAATTTNPYVTNKATVSRSTAAQYISIPVGYNDTAAQYTISGVPNMTLPTSAVTANPGVTNKATIGRSTSTQYIKIPTGYNEAAAQYTISATANGSAATPATTITQSTPSMSWNGATLTASVAQKTQSVTPTVSAGYVSSGTAGTITLGASSNATTLTTKAATTITPSASAQTAVASGSRLYFSGALTVAAVTNTGTYTGAQASKDSAVSNKTFDMGVNNLYRYVTVKGWDYINTPLTASSKKTMKCAWNTSGLSNCQYVRYTSPTDFRVRTIMFIGTDNRTSGYIDFSNNTARHDVDDVHWTTTLGNVTDWCPAANRTASAYLNPGKYIDIPVGGTTTAGYGSVIICVCGYYI